MIRLLRGLVDVAVAAGASGVARVGGGGGATSRCTLCVIFASMSSIALVERRMRELAADEVELASAAGGWGTAGFGDGRVGGKVPLPLLGRPSAAAPANGLLDEEDVGRPDVAAGCCARMGRDSMSETRSSIESLRPTPPLPDAALLRFTLEGIGGLSLLINDPGLARLSNELGLPLLATVPLPLAAIIIAACCRASVRACQERLNEDEERGAPPLPLPAGSPLPPPLSRLPEPPPRCCER